MSRTKQFNVSVPKDMAHVLVTFDKHCDAQNLSRSELILTLMSEYNLNAPENKHWADELCEHSADDIHLPEFLR